MNGAPVSPGVEMDGLETAEPTRVGAVAPRRAVVLPIPGCSQLGSSLAMHYSSLTTFSPSSSSVQLCNPRCYKDAIGFQEYEPEKKNKD